MKENKILTLLNGKQLSFNALLEKAECFTSFEKEEMEKDLTSLMDEGLVGKKNSFYFLLADAGLFLAKVTVKNRNFVILTDVATGEEHKISGYESDQLLIGDLVYAREFQKNIFHCTEYYKPTTSLKGYYSLDHNGQDILSVEYLNSCGKKVMIVDVDEDLKGQLNQGDLILGDILSFNDNIIKVKAKELLVKASDVDTYTSVDSLSGLKVAVQKGTIEEGLAKDQLSDSNIVSLTAMGEAINELKSGQVQAVDLEKPVAEGYLSQNSDLALASFALETGEGDAKAVAMPKDSGELVKTVNKVIKKLAKEDKYKQFISDAAQLTGDAVDEDE